MSWDDVGDAIQKAVERASGVTTIWKHQDSNAPSGDYVAISLGSIQTLGIDYVRTSQDLTRPLGEEIKLEVLGVAEVPLEIECFTTSGTTSGREAAALALCSKTVRGLLLPSVRSILKKKAVAPFDNGTAQWIPDIPSTKFRGRAISTVRCNMRPPSVAEYTGYIARVRGTFHAFYGNTGYTGTFDSNA